MLEPFQMCVKSHDKLQRKVTQGKYRLDKSRNPFVIWREKKRLWENTTRNDLNQKMFLGILQAT